MTAEEAIKWLESQAENQVAVPTLSMKVRECAAIIRKQADDMKSVEGAFESGEDIVVNHDDDHNPPWCVHRKSGIVYYPTLADACRAANGDD